MTSDSIRIFGVILAALKMIGRKVIQLFGFIKTDFAGLIYFS